MAEKEQNNKTTNQSEIVSLPRSPGNFLEKALQHLPEEDQQALIKKGIEGNIELDLKAQEAAQANNTCREEMGNSVGHANAINKVDGTDFVATYGGETASGDWEVKVTNSEIRVTKNSTLTVIVIAVVIGVVAVVVLK